VMINTSYKHFLRYVHLWKQSVMFTKIYIRRGIIGLSFEITIKWGLHGVMVSISTY
jgi:hypothetical protein